ncbi:trimeric intracellular cation channel family protein [Nonomuraea lactucae]|uniref:trimeric intracellular cation channel family protein n=1 Tax=Nonomuraea lactucae TaxID=2249762 RepID=UPI000DE1CAE9|nr:TRIC cation channel family protein [Nonomuraea lactucae]
MPISELTGAVVYWMDLTGIFAFALAGAFLAVRKDFNIFAAVILAEVAGLGGGLLRDLVIGVTPVAFTDPGYYLPPIAAALIVFLSSRVHRHVRIVTVVTVFDTAALALFSVTGTMKAFGHDFGPVAALTLGVASAVGGGVLCSVLAIEVPALLRSEQDLYILPALAGAGVAAVLDAVGVLNGATASGVAVGAFGLGRLAGRYRWRTPRARVWRNPFSGMRHQRVPVRRLAIASWMEEVGSWAEEVGSWTDQGEPPTTLLPALTTAPHGTAASASDGTPPDGTLTSALHGTAASASDGTPPDGTLTSALHGTAAPISRVNPAMQVHACGER